MAPTVGPERRLHVPMPAASRARLSVSPAGRKSRGDTKAATRDQENANSGLTQRRLVEYSRHRTREDNERSLSEKSISHHFGRRRRNPALSFDEAPRQAGRTSG